MDMICVILRNIPVDTLTPGWIFFFQFGCIRFIRQEFPNMETLERRRNSGRNGGRTNCESRGILIRCNYAAFSNRIDQD